MFNVQFQPGALFKLFGIPMRELLNKNIDAQLLLGGEIRDINDQLANSYSYEEIFGLVEAFFWKKIQRVKEKMHPMDKIGQMILENPHHFNLDKTASQACLSTRQFERRFVEQVGVSPKFFARMCRFHKAFKLKNATLIQAGQILPGKPVTAITSIWQKIVSSFQLLPLPYLCRKKTSHRPRCWESNWGIINKTCRFFTTYMS